MATATNVKLVRQEERKGDLIYRIRVYTFTLDTPSVANGGLNVDTANIPGIDPAKDFIMGWKISEDVTHEVIQGAHIAAVDTLHILTHNVSAGPSDPPSRSWTVVIARLAL